jgi:hypothetical protein
MTEKLPFDGINLGLTSLIAIRQGTLRPRRPDEIVLRSPRESCVSDLSAHFSLVQSAPAFPMHQNDAWVNKDSKDASSLDVCTMKLTRGRAWPQTGEAAQSAPRRTPVV